MHIMGSRIPLWVVGRWCQLLRLKCMKVRMNCVFENASSLNWETAISSDWSFQESVLELVSKNIHNHPPAWWFSATLCGIPQTKQLHLDLLREVVLICGNSWWPTGIMWRVVLSTWLDYKMFKSHQKHTTRMSQDEVHWLRGWFLIFQQIEKSFRRFPHSRFTNHRKDTLWPCAHRGCALGSFASSCYNAISYEPLDPAVLNTQGPFIAQNPLLRDWDLLNLIVQKGIILLIWNLCSSYWSTICNKRFSDFRGARPSSSRTYIHHSWLITHPEESSWSSFPEPSNCCTTTEIESLPDASNICWTTTAAKCPARASAAVTRSTAMRQRSWAK